MSIYFFYKNYLKYMYFHNHLLLFLNLFKLIYFRVLSSNDILIGNEEIIGLLRSINIF